MISHSMTRRAMIAALPLGCAGAVHALADVAPESEIARMFAQWRAIHAREYDHGLSEEEQLALVDRRCDLADEMARMPVSTASDLAMILIAYTGNGTIDLPQREDVPEFWCRIDALAAHGGR